MALPRKKQPLKTTIMENLSSTNNEILMKEVADKIFGEVNKKELEKFAREQYNMKKENEDIYLIEYDTIIED